MRDLTEGEKRRRASWFVAVALLGYMLDRGAISYAVAAGGLDASTIDFSVYAIRGLFRICIAFGFISYLAAWRYAVGRDTSMLAIFRRIVYPLVAAIVPLIPIVRLAPASKHWYTPFVSLHVLVPLALLVAVLALSRRAFREMTIGSDNMRHGFSQAYASLLFAQMPPKSRADIWMLDVLLVVVIVVIALIPLQ